MKRLIPIFVATLLLAPIALAQNLSPTEKKILDLETALGEAMIHRDIATLSSLVGDDWTIQNDTGATGTKSGFINDIKSGTLVVSAFRIHDVHIRVLGDMAFIQASDDEKSSYAGKDNSGTYNWLDVWENRNGRWVSVVTQLTKVTARP